MLYFSAFVSFYCLHVKIPPSYLFICILLLYLLTMQEPRMFYILYHCNGVIVIAYNIIKCIRMIFLRQTKCVCLRMPLSSQHRHSIFYHDGTVSKLEFEPRKWWFEASCFRGQVPGGLLLCITYIQHASFLSEITHL